MSHKTANQNDIYSRITNQIIADLERGVKSWTKPWKGGDDQNRITMPRRHNGEQYQGINILSLWASSMEQGFSSANWMTYRQAIDLGGHVLKGEKGSLVVYANTMNRTEENDQGEQVDLHIPFMKGYSVFNTEQIEGLPESFYDKPEITGSPVDRLDHAENFFAATNAKIHHGGHQAFYTMQHDYVKMPHIEAFTDAENYYATLAHEITHWTRHPDRLDRDLGGKTFGDEGYAQEELVAELGAAFISAELGIKLEDREDHAAYIASWLKALKNDQRFIFKASAYAQRAVNYLKEIQGKTGKQAFAKCRA